jgi:hypothetical protein
MPNLLSRLIPDTRNQLPIHGEHLYLNAAMSTPHDDYLTKKPITYNPPNNTKKPPINKLIKENKLLAPGHPTKYHKAPSFSVKSALISPKRTTQKRYINIAHIITKYPLTL